MLCYSILPLVLNTLSKKPEHLIVLCVSPLFALMLDQRSKYAPQGLATELVGKAQVDFDVMQQIQEGKYQLVYVSPEAVLGNMR